jgi:hypothetical protein
MIIDQSATKPPSAAPIAATTTRGIVRGFLGGLVGEGFTTQHDAAPARSAPRLPASLLPSRNGTYRIRVVGSRRTLNRSSLHASSSVSNWARSISLLSRRRTPPSRPDESQARTDSPDHRRRAGRTTGRSLHGPELPSARRDPRPHTARSGGAARCVNAAGRLANRPGSALHALGSSMVANRARCLNRP